MSSEESYLDALLKSVEASEKELNIDLAKNENNQKEINEFSQKYAILEKKYEE